MIEEYIIFLFVLFVVAALLRDEFVFTMLYLFAGVYIVGQWWSNTTLKAVTYKRNFTTRAYLGEEVPVELEVVNNTILPLIWLRIQDSLPIELSPSGSFKRVISLGPRGKTILEYTLKTQKRGYYPVGPLVIHSGDVFGLGRERRVEGGKEYLTVYPKIVMLNKIGLPSHSPIGTLRHHQPIYEDPTRIMGKREYVAGDSLRRVDWKSTAITGTLQVKKFEPSIALDTTIFVNLNSGEYELKARFDASELAIVTAASMANWIVRHKQSIGLVTNGLDPLASKQPFSPLPPRKGEGQLMRILDVLARVEASEAAIPFVELLHQEHIHLPWGTTVVLVTGQANEALFDTMFQMRRSGLEIVLIMTGIAPHVQMIRQRTDTFKIPFYNFRNEFDLDIWRK